MLSESNDDSDETKSYAYFPSSTTVADSKNGVTVYQWLSDSGLRKPTQTTDPLGRTTTMTRDALSRVVQNADPQGNKTNFSYDPMGNLLSVTDALNGQTSYSYQPGRPERNLAKVTDALSHPTQFSYDINARLTAVTNALSQSKNFSYDTENNLTSLTDPDGHNISFSYDADNRLIRKTLPEGAVNYSYDVVGNLISVADYNGSKIATTYDADNRPTQVVQTLPSGFSATIGYTYDMAGNETSMTTPWGTFNFTYDALNHETSIANPQGEKFNLSYDADGRRVGLAYPNSVQTNYGYDAASELTQIIHQKNGTALAFAEYAYDSDGNRVSMATPDGTNVYGYDPLNRLISASHPAPSNLPILNENFSYDPVGNRLSDASITNYSYNAANELVSNSSFTYSYDANGNLISKTDSAGNKTSFSYDSENELIGASMPSGVSAVYKYDALGRRIYKSTGSLPSQTQQFIYDNQNILAILDGNNNLIALFTHGPGIDEPLEIRQANGTEYFLHADGLGSIVAATDINGNLVEKIEYESYGQPVFLDERGPSPVVESQSFTQSPFAFTGREWDEEINKYFDRMRYYDPITGFFLSQDPFGTQVDPNQYRYALNNPVRFTDPSGEIVPILAPILIGAGAGAILGAGGTALAQAVFYGCVDLKSVGQAALAGGVGGALLPIIGTEYLGAGIVGIATGAGQYYLTTNNFSWTGLGAASGIGFGAGLLGGPFIGPAENIFFPEPWWITFESNATKAGLVRGLGAGGISGLFPRPKNCGCSK